MTTKISNSSKSIKARHQAKQQRKQKIERVIYGAIGLAVLVAFAFFGWNLFAPKPGESVPTQGQEHIQVGDSHPPYNSDPPTSGPHAGAVRADFYNEAPPDENLVHNLEHGYVILWYNCSTLDEAGCQGLKSQIQAVMDRAKPVSIATTTTKLIAVPRPSMDALLALTAWGRMLKLQSFDEPVITDFIDKLRGQAPEGNAP